MPEERLLAELVDAGFFVFQDGYEAAPVDAIGAAGFRVEADHVEDGGVEVRAGYGGVAGDAMLALVRPVDEHRLADAAFIHPAFSAAQRQVGGGERFVETDGPDVTR